MSKKHHGGPAPIPPGNRSTAGTGSRPEDDQVTDEHDANGGASFQEQDPKRRLGGFTGAGEPSIHQPTKLNDGQ
jgi:hypothetical protein